MEHINTLQKYKDFIAAGMPEAQAEAHVQALNASFDGVATKEDLQNAINNLMVGLKAEFRLISIVGSAIFLTCCLNIWQKLIV